MYYTLQSIFTFNIYFVYFPLSVVGSARAKKAKGKTLVKDI